MRRDHDRFKPVDFLELVSLGIRGAGHTGELAVHAKVVLKRDRRVGLVLGLNLHAFFGLDSLVQPF